MESEPVPSLSPMSGNNSSIFVVSGVDGIGGGQDIKFGKNTTRGANSWGANNTKASAEYHKNNNMSLATGRNPSFDDSWRNNIVTAQDQSDPITQRDATDDAARENWQEYLDNNWNGETFEPGYGWDDPILQWVDKNGVHHYIPNPTFNHEGTPLGYPHVQNPGDSSPHSPYGTPVNTPNTPTGTPSRGEPPTHPEDPNNPLKPLDVPGGADVYQDGNGNYFYRDPDGNMWQYVNGEWRLEGFGPGVGPEGFEEDHPADSFPWNPPGHDGGDGDDLQDPRIPIPDNMPWSSPNHPLGPPTVGGDNPDPSIPQYTHDWWNQWGQTIPDWMVPYIPPSFYTPKSTSGGNSNKSAGNISTLGSQRGLSPLLTNKPVSGSKPLKSFASFAKSATAPPPPGGPKPQGPLEFSPIQFGNPLLRPDGTFRSPWTPIYRERPLRPGEGNPQRPSPPPNLPPPPPGVYPLKPNSPVPNGLHPFYYNPDTNTWHRGISPNPNWPAFILDPNYRSPEIG